MKTSLLAILSMFLLVGCAGMRVTRTEVATGATKPRAIYIQPFDVQYAKYRDPFNPNSAAVRKSQAPILFAEILSEELAKIAPTRVLKEGECPELGWLVEGAFEVVNAGQPSTVVLHVRITDLGGENAPLISGKEGVSTLKGTRGQYGRVIYEFDVTGGSGGTGPFGSIYAPGDGNPIPFDFRNAAERIYIALTPDAFRYGVRDSPVQRQ